MRWATPNEFTEIKLRLNRTASPLAASGIGASDGPVEAAPPPLPRFLLLEPGCALPVCGDFEHTFVAPVAILERSDLEDPTVWGMILALYPVTVIDGARWWKRTVPDLPPQPGLMKAFGLGDNHRSLADWKEMSTLDDSSARMHRLYDLPLNVLRLWSRLSPGDQNIWLQIIELHRIKKNLLREIILDFYDLGPGDRHAVALECLEFARGWRAPSSSFPAQDLRDRVHRKRYPSFESLRQEILSLRRGLELPRSLQLEVPPDLESHPVYLRADLKNEQAIKDIVEFLENEENRKLLNRIAKML